MIERTEFIKMCRAMKDALYGLGFPTRLSFDSDGSYCIFHYSIEKVAIYNGDDGPIMFHNLDLSKRIKEFDTFL